MKTNFFIKVKLKLNASDLSYFHLRGSLTMLGKYFFVFSAFFTLKLLFFLRLHESYMEKEGSEDNNSIFFPWNFNP